MRYFEHGSKSHYTRFKSQRNGTKPLDRLCKIFFQSQVKLFIQSFLQQFQQSALFFYHVLLSELGWRLCIVPSFYFQNLWFRNGKKELTSSVFLYLQCCHCHLWQLYVTHQKCAHFVSVFNESRIQNLAIDEVTELRLITEMYMKGSYVLYGETQMVKGLWSSPPLFFLSVSCSSEPLSVISSAHTSLETTGTAKKMVRQVKQNYAGQVDAKQLLLFITLLTCYLDDCLIFMRPTLGD